MEGSVKPKKVGAEYSAAAAADLVASAAGGKEMSFAELLKHGSASQIAAAMDDTSVVDNLKMRRFDGEKNVLHLAFDAFRDACFSGGSARNERLQILQESFPVIFAKFPKMVLKPDAAGFNVFEYSIATRPQVVTYTREKKSEEVKSIADAFVAFYDSVLAACPTAVVDSNNVKSWGDATADEEAQTLQSFMFLVSGKGFCDFTLGQGKNKFPMLKEAISNDFKRKVSGSLGGSEVFRAIVRKGYSGLVGSVIEAASFVGGANARGVFTCLKENIGEIVMGDDEVEDSVKLLMTALSKKSYYVGYGLNPAICDDFIRSMREGMEDIIDHGGLDDRKKQQAVTRLMIIPGLYDDCRNRFNEDLDFMLTNDTVGDRVGRRLGFYKAVFGVLFDDKSKRKCCKVFEKAFSEENIKKVANIAKFCPEFVTDEVLARAMKMKDGFMYDRLITIVEGRDEDLSGVICDRGVDRAAAAGSSSKNPKAIMSPFGSSPTALQVFAAKDAAARSAK